jgi:predicted nucleic acid-binding protein
MLIFDSSTLILLARVDVLDLFLSSFGGEVVIPEKVRLEVIRQDKVEVESISRYIADNKILVMKVNNVALVKKLMVDFSIDGGEAEMLTLAGEQNAGIVATDDRNAIRACKTLKIEFVTAMAFLIRAVEKGLLSKDEGMRKLRMLQSIGRYSKQILDDAALQIHGG